MGECLHVGKGIRVTFLGWAPLFFRSHSHYDPYSWTSRTEHLCFFAGLGNLAGPRSGKKMDDVMPMQALGWAGKRPVTLKKADHMLAYWQDS